MQVHPLHPWLRLCLNLPLFFWTSHYIGFTARALLAHLLSQATAQAHENRDSLCRISDENPAKPCYKWRVRSYFHFHFLATRSRIGWTGLCVVRVLAESVITRQVVQFCTEARETYGWCIYRARCHMWDPVSPSLGWDSRIF